MIQLTTAAAMLAQLEARKAVKDQIKREREHVSHYAARNLQSTARYTALAQDRFKGFWQD